MKQQIVLFIVIIVAVLIGFLAIKNVITTGEQLISSILILLWQRTFRQEQ